MSNYSNDDDENYISIIEKMRRYIRYNRKIKVYYNSRSDLFNDFIIVLRDKYNVPNKDFSLINSSFMIDKNKYIIKEYKEYKKFTITTKTKDGYMFSTSYIIKKDFIRRKYYVNYFESANAPSAIWGFKANIARWWYKKEIRKNARIIKNELNKLRNISV